MSLDLDADILPREAAEGDHAKHGGGGCRWYNETVRAFGPYVLDFHAQSAELVDGSAPDIASVAVKDAARDAWLAAQGSRILRFGAVDVRHAKRRVDVLETIAAVVVELGAERR